MREQIGSFQILIKHVVELLGDIFVENHGVHLIIAAKASAIQIGTTHGAHLVVHHHHLCVVESSVEEIDLRASLCQFAPYPVGCIGCERNIM